MLIKLNGALLGSVGAVTDPTTLHDVTKAIHEITTQSLEGALLPFAYVADFMLSHVHFVEQYGHVADIIIR